VVDRVLILVAAAVICVFAGSLIDGDGPGSGKVLWAWTAEHGLNAGDVPVLAVAAVGLVCCALLFRRR
jgi:hypothetical protein